MVRVTDTAELRRKLHQRTLALRSLTRQTAVSKYDTELNEEIIDLLDRLEAPADRVEKLEKLPAAFEVHDAESQSVFNKRMGTRLGNIITQVDALLTEGAQS